MAFSLKRAVPTEARAQVGAATGYAGNPMVGNFMTYQTGFDRLAAIQIPTISRARDLICSMVGALEIHQYAKQWMDDEYEDLELPADTWFHQPDPNVTRNFLMSWTTDDLLFYGRAFWIVTSRFGNGFPATFTWIPAADVQTRDQAGGTMCHQAGLVPRSHRPSTAWRTDEFLGSQSLSRSGRVRG